MQNKFTPGIVVLQAGVLSVSILTPAQAKRKDGKGAVSLQGFLSSSEERKGKKVIRHVHEFSCLRDVKPSSKAGEYAWKGVLILDVSEASKDHVHGDVVYHRHNARLVRGGLTAFVEIPKVTGSMPL